MYICDLTNDQIDALDLAPGEYEIAPDSDVLEIRADGSWTLGDASGADRASMIEALRAVRAEYE